MVVGTKVTLGVNWPTTLNDQGCEKASGCSATVNIWLVSRYDVSGTALTGTVATCAFSVPPVALTTLGSQSEGLPSGQTAATQMTYPPTLWRSVLSNPQKGSGSAATGTLGGWNVGGSLQVDPVTLTYGLLSTSSLANPSTTWPCSESMISATDLTDDDNDGNPGITALPSAAAGFSLPTTAALQTPPSYADRLYVTLRTQLRLYGVSTSCTDIEGTASAPLLNSHVIGCHVASGGACTQSQWDFIDSNDTVYSGQGVKVPSSNCPASFAPQQITGTFVSKVIATSPDGGAVPPVTCSEVLAAVP